MGKEYKKINLSNLKTIEFANIVEQSLEEILNELITNNYRRHDNIFSDISKITEHKNAINNLSREIYEIVRQTLLSLKDINFSLFKLIYKKESLEYENTVNEIIRIMIFVSYLQIIVNDIELIKSNINELYKYPAIKKQAYIPEFCLSLSFFLKENIDNFFIETGKNKNEEPIVKMEEELVRIISLGNKIMNEFFLNYENGGDNKNFGNQIIYYSGIISILESISINIIQFAYL